MKKTIICTTCPRGCHVEAEYTCRGDLKLSGNGCERGRQYCIYECFEPKRTFTASVRLSGASRRRLPVRSDAPMPKDKLLECAAYVRSLDVEAPLKIHQTICENILGTGVDIISSMTIEREA